MRAMSLNTEDYRNATEAVHKNKLRKP